MIDQKERILAAGIGVAVALCLLARRLTEQAETVLTLPAFLAAAWDAAAAEKAKINT